MGQEILYCCKCRSQIRSADFEKGAGLRIGERACCAQCAPALLAELSPRERAEFFRHRAEPRPEPKQEALPARPMTESSARRITRATVSPPRRSAALVAGLAAGGAVLLIAALAVAFGRPKPPPPAASTPEPPTPQPPPLEPPKRPEPEPSPPPPKPVRDAGRAKEILARAQTLARDPAEPPDNVLQVFQEAALAADATPEAPEVARALEAYRAVLKERFDREIEKLDKEASELSGKELFGQAIDLYEKARGRYRGEEWGSRVSPRPPDIHKKAQAAIVEILRKAEEAERNDRAAEVKALRERVASWGLPEHGAVLDRKLAEIRAEKEKAHAKSELTSELEKLDEETGELLRKEAFGKALDLHEKALGKHADEEWKKFLTDRMEGIRGKARAAFEAAARKAVEAEKKDAAAEVKAVRERVAGWGLPDFPAALEQRLAPVRTEREGERLLANTKANALLLRWTFDDDGTKVTDSSRFGHHGLLSREGAARVNGVSGKALVLDGTGSVRCRRTGDLEPKAITISIWICRKGPQATWWTAVFRKVWRNNSDPVFTSWGIQLNPGGKGADMAAFYTGHESGLHELVTPANAIPDGKWVHVAAVYDPAAASSRKRIYVDGALVASAEFTKPILYDPTPSGDVWAGQNCKDADYFTGSIDEARVYGRALSEAEIKVLSRR